MKSDVIAYKADWQGKAEELEMDIVFDADIPLDILYAGTVEKIRDVKRSIWHAGAGIHEAVARDPQKAYDKLSKATGESEGYLKEIQRVYANTRQYAIPTVCYSIHKIAASLPEPKRERFLNAANDEHWTREIALDKAAEIKGSKRNKPTGPVLDSSEKETSPNQQSSNKDLAQNSPDSASDTIDAEFSSIEEPTPSQVVLTLEQAIGIAEFLHYIYPFLENQKERKICEGCLILLGSSPPKKNEVAPHIDGKKDKYLKERLKKTSMGANPKKRKVTVAMKPPTLEEVTEYGKEIGLPKTGCANFFDYWSSKGWKPKGGPMEDWKPRLRMWKRNNYDAQPPSANGRNANVQSMAARAIAEMDSAVGGGM